LWELCGIPAEEEELPVVKAEFSVQFRPPVAATSDWSKYSYNFEVIDYSVNHNPNNYHNNINNNNMLIWLNGCHLSDVSLFHVSAQTLFTIRSRVDPVKGNDFLRAGSLCHMTLTINTVQNKSTVATALMYEVLADQAMWAVCGRTAGVFSMEGASKHSVTLDVMPLVYGFLPLPAVRLSRYIPAEQKSKGN